ncbi:MAG: alpha-amylase family protein [Bryobacteraceae bacterium]|jgi:hypothetical protein
MDISRRSFLGSAPAGLAQGSQVLAFLQPRSSDAPKYDWMQSARIFLIDAYGYPFTPKLEFDAEKLAATMTDMHANTVRIATMGKYATIQGVRFSTHPDQGGRDMLAETIAASKPRGIRVVAYISTGHRLAWSMVTRDYPEYAHISTPGGGPVRSRFGTGEDHGTVCWNTPYRQAYLDLIRHVVRDYDIDGIYFDTWWACYFYPGVHTCYCEGCRRGFKTATGLEIPYHERHQDYTTEEWRTIDRYYDWYQDQLMGVLQEVRRIVRSFKDIPLIYNVNTPQNLLAEDPRVLENIDAFLYERGNSLVERAEGVSLARAMGLSVWPYAAESMASRVMTGGLNSEQEIFTTAMFGGGPIASNPYLFVERDNDREPLRYPFGVMERHQDLFTGVENYPYVLTVWGPSDPPGSVTVGRYRAMNGRTATLGAFTACLYQHLQVSSAVPNILDDLDRLRRYRVVYLASVPYLSPKQVENLKQFVAGGGGLIASNIASLYEKKGQPKNRPGHLRNWKSWMPLPDPVTFEERETFALEELLHVRPFTPEGSLAQTLYEHSEPNYSPRDLYLRTREDSGIPDFGRADRSLPLWNFQTVRPLDGGRVLGDIVCGGERTALLAGVVLSQYGRGHAIYLASAVDSLYGQTNIRLIARFIGELVRMVAPEPPPYTVEGPDCLFANLTAKGRTRVLHLMNWTGNKFEGNARNEHFISPLENVRVRLRNSGGGRISQLRLLIDAPYKRANRGDSIEILLPKMGAYQAIAFELCG